MMITIITDYIVLILLLVMIVCSIQFIFPKKGE